MSALSLSSGRSMRFEDWLITDLLSPPGNSPWYLFGIAAFSLFGLAILYLLPRSDLAGSQSRLVRLGLQIAPLTAFFVVIFAISTPIPIFRDFHVCLAYLVFTALLTTIGLILLGLSKQQFGRLFWSGLLQFCGLATMAIYYLGSLRSEPNYALLAIFEWSLIICIMWGLWEIVRYSEKTTQA